MKMNGAEERERDSAETEPTDRLEIQVPLCLGKFGAFWLPKEKIPTES